MALDKRGKLHKHARITLTRAVLFVNTVFLHPLLRSLNPSLLFVLLFYVFHYFSPRLTPFGHFSLSPCLISHSPSPSDFLSLSLPLSLSHTILFAPLLHKPPQFSRVQIGFCIPPISVAMSICREFDHVSPISSHL